MWHIVCAQVSVDPKSIHGPSHWRRVLANGEKLAKRTGADLEVVRLFAVFHDSRREHDGHDPDHGARGAVYAAKLRGQYFEVTDAQFALLQYACEWHTKGRHHADPTIATCWDADRLDLGRCGMTPDPRFMSTEFGKELARKSR